MSKVASTELPVRSLLKERVATQDFLDCYSVSSTLPPRRAAEIITQFPEWAGFLLSIRSVVTAPFGLMTYGPEAKDKLGPFPVEFENQHELIAGFDDKHLDFRVSVISESGKVSLATWVHTHNIGGKVYLATIMPFHILIARNALARVAAAEQNS